MNNIERRLALIDKQLAGHKDFHKQIINTSPLLFAAVGLIVGILLQNRLDLPLTVWLTLLGFCAIATVTFYAAQKQNFPSYIIAYTALVCFICLGAIRLTNYYQPKPNDIRCIVADEPELATIRGLIITEPRVNDYKDWKFARFKFTDPGSSFYMKVKEVDTTDGWAKITGTVRVQVAEPVLDLKAGDYIQAYCWLDRFKQVSNPGQFDTAEYLARKNVFIAVSIKSRNGIELLENPPNSLFTKIKAKLRQAATNALIADLSLEAQSRGLLQALQAVSQLHCSPPIILTII